MKELWSGYRILDLSNGIAGGFATRLFASFGAEVILVERPTEGCGLRRRGPFIGVPGSESSPLFLYIHAGKKSVTLNLNAPSGIKLFWELVKRADVVVEDSSPAVMENSLLSYEKMKIINPEMILCSVSPFGQFGSYRDYKGSEIVYEALSGILYQTGPYECPPVMAGIEQGQYLAGINTALAIGASLFSRQERGRGEHLDVSVMESILPWADYGAIWYTYVGAVFRRLGKVPTLTDILIPTKDGYICPAFVGYVDWEALSAMLGSTELADPRFASWEGRIKHAEEVAEAMKREFAKWETEELLSLAQQWGFAFGALKNAKDLYNCPQLIDREFLVEHEHPVCGKVRYPSVPFKMSETPGQVKHAAPLLGEHNLDVYCGLLEYAEDDVAKLREASII